MREGGTPWTVVLVALALAASQLLVPLPGWWGGSPPEKVFLGFRYMAGDHFQYAAFIREARDTGALLMQDPFTTDPQRGVFLLPFFWIVGLASRLAGGSIPLAWDAFRVAGAFACVMMFWRFATPCFTRRSERVAATVVFAFAGGIDWIVTLLRVTVLPKAAPLEYAFSFFWNWSGFGMVSMPNWTWPALLLMAAAASMLRGGRGRFVPAVLLPIVWLMHAYTGMVGYALFGLLPLMPLLAAALTWTRPSAQRVRRNLGLVLPGLASFAVVAVYLLWARQDQVFRAVSDNGFLWTTRYSVAWYTLSYGLLLPFALYGFVITAQRGEASGDLLLAWASAALLLSVNPFFAGVKFQYLLFIPLCTLAVRGFYALREDSARFRRLARHPAAVAAAMPLLFLNAPIALFRDLPTPGVEIYAYVPEPERRAMAWLSDQPDGGVLCHHRTGNMIPWLSGKHVVSGHWFMSPSLKQRLDQTDAFYNPAVPPGIKQELLRLLHVRYVYEGGRELALGRVDPNLGLRLAYQQDGVAIWEVPPAR
jgi:hypothetical protein